MKIAIIGAGINGLYISWKLAQKGYKVTVFERKKEIGKQACSGLFSENILNFIPESKALIKNEINYCYINFPKRKIKLEFFGNNKKEKFYVIDHDKLDKLVLSLAQQQGVEIILGAQAEDIKLNKLKENFDRIIGCDGAMSETRKSLNLKDPDLYLGILVLVDNSDKKLNNFVETWATKNGFLWKIYRDKNIVEYGIMDEIGESRKIFDRFLKEKNINFKVKRSAIIPCGLVLSSNSKITLCGDAMGLTKPWSGGGVIWGLTAGDILLSNFPDFKKYKKEVKRFFLFKIIIYKLIKKIVYFLGFYLPWFLPRKVKINSDFLIYGQRKKD